MQTLESLQAKVENMLTETQKKINSVSETLKTHQGQPRQLEISLKQESNEKSQTIQTLDSRISKTVKEVKELQDTLIAVTEKEKTGSEVLQAGYAMPMKPCTVKEAELPSKQPSVLGFPISINQSINSAYCQRMKLRSQSQVKGRV